MRSEDKRKVEAAKSGGNTENENGGDQGKESAEVQLSAALVEDLTSTPNRGLASSARDSPGRGAAAHSLALRVCYETPCYEVGSCLSLTSEKGGCALDPHAKGIEHRPNAVVRDPLPVAKADPGRTGRTGRTVGLVA